MLGFAFDPGVPSAETLAFQATMPALAVERTYRGVASVLLLGLIGRKAPPRQVPWAVVLVTAAMFCRGAGSATAVAGSRSNRCRRASPWGGLAYGWMRFNSGNLVFPSTAFFRVPLAVCGNPLCPTAGGGTPILPIGTGVIQEGGIGSVGGMMHRRPRREEGCS